MGRWRNIYYPGAPNFEDVPSVPPDAFADGSGPLTVVLSVKDGGQATYQWRLKGLPIGGMPPATLNATYDGGMIVAKAPGSLMSMSFTLGWRQWQ